MTDVRTVHAIADDDLLRDAEGHVLCEFCGEVMDAWSPIEGATWYECDCGEVMVVVGGGDMLGQQVSYEGAHGPVKGEKGGCVSGYACSSPLYEFEGWLFEWHHYCGPWPLRKDLELRARAGRRFWAMYDRFRALPEAEREQYRVGGGCERWVGSVVAAEVSDD